MKFNPGTHFISSKDCPYTMKGKKLTELRRAQLRPLARALRVEHGQALTKNDLLVRIMGRLSAIGAESEIGNVGANS